MLNLRFPKTKLHYWSSRYPISYDANIENVVNPTVQQRGYYTKPELTAICYWKTPRTRSRVMRNSDTAVKELSRLALSTSEESLRIQSLTLLNGVGWPSASVLLHFGHKDRYPILDYRALWALGLDSPPAVYTFDFWWEYVLFCRDLAEKAGVSMRVLDRALWQYSKEYQKNGLKR
jgi:hypothetical protein